MKLSLIVPCFNEQEALPPFYAELSGVLQSLNNYSAQIIFVDDGSKDDTLSIIKGFAKEDERVKYISFSRNFGKEAAMYAGLKNADGDFVAIMDADLQDPPSLLPQMLEILASDEYDSVATRRADRKGEPPIRSLCAKTFYKILNKSSKSDVADGARDFRLMKRKMVDAILSMSEVNRFTKGIFGWVGFKTYWLPFENAERVAGKTKWSFRALMNYSVAGLINFSDFPVKLIFGGGCLFTFTAAIALVVLLVLRLCSVWFSSVITIVSFMALFCGINLLALGVIARYAVNTYFETKHRPIYICADSNIDGVN